MKTFGPALALSGLLLSGCSVMHFKNGPGESAAPVKEAWHHNAAYALMEVSKPVDLKALCGGQGWNRVTTQDTFLTGLAGAVDDFLVGLVVPYVPIDLWDPQHIEWVCTDGAGSAAPAAAAPADTAGGATP